MSQTSLGHPRLTQDLSLKQNGAPFFWVALIWLFSMGLLLGFVLEKKTVFQSLGVFSLLWSLAVFDLMALSKLIRSFILSQKAELPFWFLLKFLAFALMGWVIFKAQNLEPTAIILGLGTLVIVPVVGGFWWNRREWVQQENG